MNNMKSCAKVVIAQFQTSKKEEVQHLPKYNIMAMKFHLNMFFREVIKMDGTALDDEYNAFSAAQYSCHLCFSHMLCLPFLQPIK